MRGWRLIQPPTYHVCMSDFGDWRLQGQEQYLREVSLRLKPYRIDSETSDHDHCAFCGAKFVDPDYAKHQGWNWDQDWNTEGYATTNDYVHGADYEWICVRCFADFNDRFNWNVVT